MNFMLYPLRRLLPAAPHSGNLPQPTGTGRVLPQLSDRIIGNCDVGAFMGKITPGCGNDFVTRPPMLVYAPVRR